MGDLKIGLKFPSKVHFESDPILGWNGVISRHSILIHTN